MLRPLRSLLLLLYICTSIEIVLLTNPYQHREQRVHADFDLNQPAILEDDEIQEGSENHHTSLIRAAAPQSPAKEALQCEHNTLCAHWPELTRAEKTKVYWDRYKKKTPKETLKLQAKLRNKRFRERKAIPLMDKKIQNRIRYENDSIRYAHLTEDRKLLSQKRPVSKSKAPFLWDLNKDPPDEESKVGSWLSEGRENGSNKESIVEATIGSGRYWGTRKRRTDLNPAHRLQIRNPLAVNKTLSKPDQAERPSKLTAEQKQRYSLQRKLIYAALRRDERKAINIKRAQQEKDRVERMNIEERKAYVARERIWKKQNRVKLENTRTEEQKQEYKAKRAIVNRKYYLSRKAKENQ
ncbi:uncharacterized protein FA14DRAFT_156245 [Meira miltonrushii]|uniref:Uncharacterized protein n=1 Tax=Meira miltonrushii TaxID=1280837 RepID=A0A316V8L4_9BASI|nr:uncharacterized protein FA14DRAFT_156245 [Meira miltonrushii]PWN33554.1 hypothetical protein FA14DRAFT_156245 [Meira miltonrushii]